MEPHPGPWIIILIVACIIAMLLIEALLVAAEKAIESVNRTSIRELAQEGNSSAKRLLTIFEKPSNFVTASKVTIVFISFISGGIFLVYGYLWAQNRWPDGVTTTVGILILIICALIYAFVFVVFILILPRQVALKHLEGVALKLSGFATFFSALCRPFVVFNRAIANVILKIARQTPYAEEEEFSEEEVMSLLEVGQETGVLKEEGKRMIDSIFAFDDKLAYEIMTPRTDVFCIDICDEEKEYLEELLRMRYSRIPIYEEDNDDIIGILNIKDFLIKAREDGFENVNIREILRKPVFVPDTKNIDSLFFDLQKTKQHIAILIDEYGGFSGIVTMEDIIEEVMGEIDDEYDEEEIELKKIGHNEYYVDGNMSLDDLNDEVGTELTSDTSETVGGLLIDKLGEIPEDNTYKKVEIDNCTFITTKIKDRRIERVRLTIHDKKPESENQENNSEK